MSRHQESAQPFASTMLALVALLCLAGGALSAPGAGTLWTRGSHERILNGTEASVADFPWMLSLQVNGSHGCGASVLSSSWALTAAHCVFGQRAAFLSVRAGTSTQGSGGVVLNVSQAIMHAGFSIFSAEYDVALVQVSEPFPLGPNIQPVSLPEDGYDPPAGLPVAVSGWGNTLEEARPTVLQTTSLAVLERSECQERLGSIHNVTASMLCAGDRSSAVCYGDSGSPLVHGGTQLGTVSWGRPNCFSRAAIYGNVASVRAWIRDITGA